MNAEAAALVADLPDRIGALATKWAAIAPDRPALVEPSGTWRYGDLPGIVAATRAWLTQSGVRPGDRVMIVAENCRATVALLLGAASLDAWPLIVNARLSDREIDQIRDLSGSRRTIYTIAVSPRARLHAARHGADAVTVEPLGTIALGPLNRETAPEPVETSGADQVATVIYTSGTTGVPKGVMLTHRNLLFVAKVSGLLRHLGPEDRVYGVLPASHVLGLSVVLLGALYHGATLHLTARFDPAAILAALERDRLTFIIGAPGLYALMAEYAKLKGIARLENHGLRVIATAGAPLDPTTKAAAEALFGLPLNNGYGITECAPSISQTRLDSPRLDCSVGPLWPGVEVKLVGADGQAVAPGEIGELRVRGPNLMKGYYRAPEETAAAIDGEGWFNTRDLARIEDDHLFIAGRSKELIIRFGFNVYPPEVETVLNAHPGVTQSAVIGRSVSGTEEIIAFVQAAPNAHLSDTDLADHAARQLAPYKRPTEIFVLPSLPAGANGKILKSALLPIAEELLAQRRAA
ncbi:MAG TPA: class I adenylate-forming enzyme family protein [Stellaceae bacterium]